MRSFFKSFILLFIFMSFTQIVYGQEQLSGSITFVDANKLTIGNRILNLDENSDIIYSNRLGSQLIAAQDIPLGTFGIAYLEDTTITNLEVSGRTLSGQEIILQEILKIGEYIDKFQLSHDGKFFAYYSQGKNKLMVREVVTKKIVWQQDFTIAPTFRFNPQSCELTYSFFNNSFYGLAAHNLLTNCDRILIQEPLGNNEYINYFEIAPNGEYIVFTTLTGAASSQGYVSKIHLVDKLGQNVSNIDVSNVYSINWSPDSSAFAYSRYEEPNLETSQIGYYNLKVDNYFLLDTEKNINQFNPSFAKDSNKLIYSHSENFIDTALLYDLTFNRQVELFEDFNYISDFCWLDNNILLYTYGDLPQMKLIDLNTKDTLNISNGHNPQVINNILYFLRNDFDGNTCLYSIKLNRLTGRLTNGT